MKTAMQEFKFEGGALVRVPVVENETSWFVAADVCEALGIADTSQAVDRLDEDEKKKGSVSDGAQAREAWLVNEFGVFQLIMTSSKPEAKKFKRWITHEVLPTIRRSGKYTTEQAAFREKEIQGKVRDIELLYSNIKSANIALAELKKKHATANYELKEFLKADLTQLKLKF